MRRHATSPSRQPSPSPRVERTTSSRLRALPAPAPSLSWGDQTPRAVARSLFGSLVHDVRSPLMALSMNLHGIEEELRRRGVPIEGELSELLADAREASTAIAENIELVRAQTVDGESTECFDVEGVVATALRYFRWYAQQRGVRVVSEVRAGARGHGHAGEVGWTLLHALVRASEPLAAGETVVVRASEREGGVRFEARGVETIEVLVDDRGAIATRLASAR